MKRAAAAVLVLLACTLAGCAGGDEPPQDPAPTDPSPGPADGAVRFVVIGDGGNGQDAQIRVAEGIAALCAQRPCDFVAVAGDVIYPDGVRSPYDPQFESKFEEPYANVDLPFYLVLGNHDNGNGEGSNPIVGDYQVQYSQRTDRLTDKFHMPARHYNVTFGDGLIDFFFIDSGAQEVATPAIYLPDGRGEALTTWLTEAFAQSTATWKFLIAHHPYKSNGAHGDAGMFDGRPTNGLAYKMLLEDVMCGNAQVMFAGHDHSMNWLAPVAECGSTQFIVSGAGGAGLYDRGQVPHSESYFEDYEHHGFFWIEVKDRTFTGVAYDADGNQLFERSFTI